MIDHIGDLCVVWGCQRRAMDFGIGQGYPEENPLAEIQALRLSDKAPTWWRKKPLTAKGLQDFIVRPTQFTEEGHRGDGLLVARAIKGCPEDLRKILYIHYVIMVFPPEGVKMAAYKAQQIGITENEYWRLMDRAHHFILGRLPVSEEGYLTVGTGKPQIRGIPAKVVEVSPAKTAPTPELNLKALVRERLKVFR